MSAPGWYPDPSGAPTRRYWDGKQWAPPPPPPRRNNTGGKVLLFSLLGVVLLFGGCAALVVIGSAAQDREARESAAVSTPTAVVPPRPGVTKPEGVTFAFDENLGQGTMVATFDITDAVLMMFTRPLAQAKTKEILAWVERQHPEAQRVQVIGRFLTNDGYGNTSMSNVLDVTYARATVEKMNFDGYIEDVWALRDYGFVHPELQGR